MIGDFRFEDEPGAASIVVEMFWDDQGRAARLLVPLDLAKVLTADQYPDHTGTHRLEGALSFGIMLAAKTKTPMRLSGDSTVWPLEWGELSFL